jgi:hypothetical protein
MQAAFEQVGLLWGHDTDAPLPNNGASTRKTPGGPWLIGWLWR